MMEFNLSRTDYTQVAVTAPKCLKLLPNVGRRNPLQRVAVGDREGCVQVFGMKDGQVVSVRLGETDDQSVYKTLPGTPISRLELGGQLGQTREKIFVAAGTDVRGYTKKGKQFLQFDTNITEQLKALHIEGSHLFVAGNYIYQHYQDLRDTDYLLCADLINDLICLPMEKVEEATPVLACQDRVLRVLKGSDLHYEVEVPGPPTTLGLLGNTGGDMGDEVLYGTADGKVGLVNIGDAKPTHRWELTNEKSQGGITCMDNYDITADGVPELILGRNDGTVDIYTFDETDEPQLKLSVPCTESITSVQGGIVGNPSYDEIVCSSYAGWIFGLSTQQQVKAVGSATVDPSQAARLAQLKAEIEELQGKVMKEREKYHSSSSSSKAVSAVPRLHVEDRFQLNPEEAAYVLCIECQAPIDNVLAQADVPVDLLDVDKNSAVVSYSQCNPEEGNYLLATYRCQANTTRLELKIRSIEGQYGSINVYVTPRLQPKVCQVKVFPVKPLSLHRRTHDFDETRPLNQLTLTGAFSQAEMHAWVAFCLPETPERVPNEDQVRLTFDSTFLGTQLECLYRKGEAKFRSDNLSTISILKDVLTKEATKRKIVLNISFDINDASVAHTLRLINPKMESLLLLAKKVQLIEPLRELKLNEAESGSFLSKEYTEILDNADQLQAEFKRQPCHLERLYGKTMGDDLFDVLLAHSP